MYYKQVIGGVWYMYMYMHIHMRDLTNRTRNRYTLGTEWVSIIRTVIKGLEHGAPFIH